MHHGAQGMHSVPGLEGTRSEVGLGRGGLRGLGRRLWVCRVTKDHVGWRHASCMRVLVALLAVGLLAGCAGSDGGSPEGPQSGTVDITMRGFAFEPREAWVTPGTTLRFINQDSTVHTATADAFDTGDVASGDQASVTVDGTGDIAYVCVYHEAQDMTGTVHVVP